MYYYPVMMYGNLQVLGQYLMGQIKKFVMEYNPYVLSYWDQYDNTGEFHCNQYFSLFLFPGWW